MGRSAWTGFISKYKEQYLECFLFCFYVRRGVLGRIKIEWFANDFPLFSYSQVHEIFVSVRMWSQRSKYTERTASRYRWQSTWRQTFKLRSIRSIDARSTPAIGKWKHFRNAKRFEERFLTSFRMFASATGSKISNSGWTATDVTIIIGHA